MSPATRESLLGFVGYEYVAGLWHLINQVGTLISTTRQLASGLFLIVVTIQIYPTRRRNH